jgi:hypothetical protein
MSTHIEHPRPPAHKDARTGCIAFGVLEILMGIACVLLVPLLLVAASLPPQEANHRQLISSVATCVLAAVAFVWLGVGSISCRRWARTLLLIVAWSWLVAGVMMIVVLAIVMSMMASQLATGAAGIAVILLFLAILGLFLVVVPGALLLFYQNRNVQATFEARDPSPRWTDACPLPVLMTALWIALGALLTVPAIASRDGIFPLFGRLLSGSPAAFALLLAAGVSLWLAWALYRLQPAALWAAVALTVVGAVSAVVTFARVDFLEVYRLMGYPQEQIDMVRQMGLLGGQRMAWLMALMGLATVIFFIWLRKYFPGAKRAPTGN